MNKKYNEGSKKIISKSRTQFFDPINPSVIGSDKYIDSTLIWICINVNLLTNTALLRLMIASGTRANVYIETQFLYLHKFFYGGVTTFTAHLLHTMGLTRKGRKRFISLLSLETAVADAAAPYY